MLSALIVEIGFLTPCMVVAPVKAQVGAWDDVEFSYRVGDRLESREA